MKMDWFPKRLVISVVLLSLLFPGLQAEEQPQTTHQDQHHSDSGSHSDSNHDNSKEFNPGDFIIDHIQDSHEWHLWTNADGDHVSLYLPIILYSKEQGFKVFMSSKLAHGHHFNRFFISHEGEFEGKILEETPQGDILKPLDFSVTKNVVAMFSAAILLLFIFMRMGKTYRSEKNVVPKGLNAFLEPIVLFIRDEIAKPNIGHEKYERFMPYLLTVFFFILLNNLMGLVPPIPPFGANVTGNIAVTLTLALFTFLITQFSGTRDHWRHVVATPGVPFWLAPIMIPVEIIGLISKPFALMVRLFANITSGHIIVLSLVSVIFIFKTILVSPVSIAFVLFMETLEILVAFLQSYVFTLLSALFIGLAAKEHHH